MDTLAALCESARARCEARAGAVRDRGPLVLVLDSLPAVPACERDSRELVALVNRSSGLDIQFGKRKPARVRNGKPRSIDWQAEIDRQTRRYGVVRFDGEAHEPGVSAMLRLVEQGLYEHDEGRDDPYGGSNSFNLLDYGWLADGCGLRACAVDCTREHYYSLGHALYRQAVRAYGVSDKRAKRLERFADPVPSGADLARASAGRSGGRINHSAAGRAVLKQARADRLAQGNE